MARNDEVAVLRDRRAFQGLAAPPVRPPHASARRKSAAARGKKKPPPAGTGHVFSKEIQPVDTARSTRFSRRSAREVSIPNGPRSDIPSGRRPGGPPMCGAREAGGGRPDLPRSARYSPRRLAAGDADRLPWRRDCHDALGRQRPEGGAFRIRDGKIGARTVPLTPEAAAVLGKVRRDRGSPGGSPAAHATGSRRDAGHVAGQAGGPGSVSRDRHRQPVHGPKAAEPQPGARRHPGPWRLAVRRRRHRMTFSVCRFDRIGTRSHYRTVEWTS